MRSVCAIIVFLGAAIAPADDGQRRRELAGDLLDALEIKATLAASMEMMKTMMTSQVQQMQKQLPAAAARGPQAKAIHERMMARTMDLVTEELAWERMRESYIEVYAETLTAEEMEGLIVFFRSPVGRSYVQKQPELMQRAAAVTQKATAGMVPKIMALQAEVMKEVRDGATPEERTAPPDAADREAEPAHAEAE